MTSNDVLTWLEGPQHTKFFTQLYKAASPKAVLVFVHGFGDHCNRYAEFLSKLADSGITVFTYDQRGFGRTAQDAKEKSKTSSYGKTCWNEQMEDLNWAITHAKKEFPGLPVYIAGQSMGGGEVLGFSTEGPKSPYASTVASLSGVIATSPMIQQTVPVNRFLRAILGVLRLATPNLLFPANLVPTDLSRDATVAENYFKDEFVQDTGSLRGLADMLDHGDELKEKRWRVWPKNLPVLFCHGTHDRITDPSASKAFHDNIIADTKKYVTFEGAFHELSNELPETKEQLLKEVASFIEQTLVPQPEAAKL